MKKEPEYPTIPVFRYDNIQLATVIGIHVKTTSELCPMKIKNKEKPGKTRKNCVVSGICKNRFMTNTHQ